MLFKRYLKVVVHPRAHKLSEGVIGPLPDPAVNGHALRPKANGLRLEVSFLKSKDGQNVDLNVK